MTDKNWARGGQAEGRAWYEASPLLCMARDARRIEGECTDSDGADDGCSAVLMRLAAALPQLNLAIGLRGVAYDEGEYVNLLRACAQAYAQRAEALESAYAARDAAGMRLQAHTLSGSLTSIGAEMLGVHARELEMVIYDGRAAQVRIQTLPFLAELRGFVDQLRLCFAEQDAAQPAMEGYPPMWCETAMAMQRRAAACDYTGALELLRALEWAHAPADGPWLAAVRRALEGFDYTALRQLLQDSDFR